MIYSADGRHRLLLVEVPRCEARQNRIHLDLRPAEGTRDAELARLVGLGASLLADHRSADGTGWVTLADPEGNEFCLLRSKAEVANQRL
jgi:hypothetical protein